MMKKTMLVSWAAAAALVLIPACYDKPEGVAGVGQICSDDVDCAVGLKCINNACAVLPGNLAPLAEAGANRVTVQGFEVSLDASNSSDPEGQPLSYAWVLRSSPSASTATLASPDAAVVKFTPDAAGVYDLELTVNDGVLDSAVAKVAVFVFDADGKFPTLPAGSECVEDFQCASGDCTDGKCAANFPPSANGGASREVLVGELLELSAAGSSDPDGDVLTFSWQLTQTPVGSNAVVTPVSDGLTASFTPDVIGLYVVTLLANDGKLSSSPATVGIYAGDASALRDDGEPCTKDDECNSDFCYQGFCKTNQAPIADAGGPQLGAVDAALNFDGGNSSDPDGLTLTYAWDINKAPDGSTATLTGETGQTPSLVPDLAGLYLVRLVVNDGQLNSLPSVVAVVVAETSEGLPVGGQCGQDSDCQSNKCLNTACAANAAPVANAGPAQDVVTGDTVSLDGSASADGDGDPITYTWALQAPTGSVAALVDPTSVAPSFVADLDGIYQVSLVVSDGNLASVGSVTAIVATSGTVGLPVGDPCATDGACASNYCAPTGCATNGAPTAVVNELLYVEPTTAVQLDGTASSDPEGHPLTYAWTITDQPAGSSAALDDATVAQPTFTPNVAGVYFFELLVNDGYDDSAPAIGAVIVQAGTPNGSPCTANAQCISGICDSAGSGLCEVNAPPVADAGTSQIIETGLTVNLSGAASTDPEGQPLTYMWTLVGRPAGSTATVSDNTDVAPSFVADLEGLYTLQLSVSDGYNVADAGVAIVSVVEGLLDDGEPCTDSAQCSSGSCVADVCAPNTRPVASAVGPSSVLLGASFPLDGTASSDPDSEPITYAWSLISAPQGSSASLTDETTDTASIVPDVAGTYSFLLIVSDGKLNSEPVGINVVVPPNDAPNAELTVLTVGPYLVGAPIDLDASASSDPNGDPLTYGWSFLTAPNGMTATFDGTGSTSTFTPNIGGTYVARVSVTDGALTDFDVAVVVVVGLNAPPIADAGNNTLAAVGSPSYLFGHNSTDGDGDILTYSWAVVTEPAGSSVIVGDSDTAVAQVSGLVAGEYTFELTVSDGIDSDTDTVIVTAAVADQPLAPYWNWVGDLVGTRVLYYVDNETYETWTFTSDFADVASGVSGVLLDRHRLGPWVVNTQAVFDWVVQWDDTQGLLLMGLTGDVPGVGIVTTAAEPPLVLYPAATFTTGAQTFYSLIQTYDESGIPITQVMRRIVGLDEGAGENPALNYSNDVAGGTGTTALLLDVRTKTGQGLESVAQEALVADQGMFAQRRAPGLLDFEELFSFETAASSRLLLYNDTVPTPGGPIVVPASEPVPLAYETDVCLPDAIPCVDNLNVSSAPSADCPPNNQYCRYDGTCTFTNSISSPYCPLSNRQYSALDPYSPADWSGQTPVWVDPFDQVTVPGIDEGMDIVALFLAFGKSGFNVQPYTEDYMFYGFIALDDDPHPNMRYTVSLRQDPPFDTVGDIEMEMVYDEFFNGCCGGPWQMTARQSIGLGLGPDIGCDAIVEEVNGGLAFAIPAFTYGGYDFFERVPLPSIYELIHGIIPGTGGQFQNTDNRAYIQFEACGLYADGCSDAILAPLQVVAPEPEWHSSFDYCGGGTDQF